MPHSGQIDIFRKTQAGGFVVHLATGDVWNVNLQICTGKLISTPKPVAPSEEKGGSGPFAGGSRTARSVEQL
jgi:hypothetical protein